MYLIPIAWLYVAVMMAAAEANNPRGTLLGAIITLVLYGVLPVALVVYLMGHPGRRRARAAREKAERSNTPDAGGEAPADPVSPVRKEP